MKSLKENGVDNTYNDFCIPMKVENAYGVFWEDSRYGNINRVIYRMNSLVKLVTCLFAIVPVTMSAQMDKNFFKKLQTEK